MHLQEDRLSPFIVFRTALILIALSSAVNAQQNTQTILGDTLACSADTLDPFPTLLGGYCEQAIHCARYSLPPTLPLVPEFRTDSVTPTGESYFIEYKYEPPQRSWNENIRVLAWVQERTALNVRHEQPSDSMGYVTWTLLIWNKSVDTAGKPQWSLMQLKASIDNIQGNIDTSLWSPIKFYKDNEFEVHCCEIYSTAPTNKQIYQFIEDKSFGRLLEQKTLVRGIPGQMDFLMGGDVREKTWEACIGEPPTKFFFFEK